MNVKRLLKREFNRWKKHVLYNNYQSYVWDAAFFNLHRYEILIKIKNLQVLNWLYFGYLRDKKDFFADGTKKC